jgi:hypothetical protein
VVCTSPPERLDGHVGDRNFKFHVVRSGEIEIIDPSGETLKTIVVHGPGEARA